MKNGGVTTAIIQDKRIQRKDGTYAIKLRVTFNREQKYYPLNPLYVSLTIEEWEKTLVPNPRGKAKEDHMYFSEVEARAKEVIKELHPFTFLSFEEKFSQKVDRSKDVLFFMKTYIEQLSKEGRSGTADSYKCASVSFSKFIKSKNRKKLHFADLTPGWLNAYEKWMLNEKKGLTTIGIYLRSLRTIVNIGIENGMIAQEAYPFGKRKYQIPAGQNIKKALPLADIKKIFEYRPTTEAEQKARDLWLFSYLCNGTNVKDIARLQYRNITQKDITYVRAKTARTTKKDLKKIHVRLLPEIKEIIERWGIKPATPETFVFGILSKSDSPEKELAKVRQATKTINKYMQRIGKHLDIDINMTTYTARHSFATVLKRSGVSVEFISESLGHKDLRTTENYLDCFEDDEKESQQRQLLNFK